MSSHSRRACDEIADRRITGAARAPRPSRGPSSGAVPAQLADTPYTPATPATIAEKVRLNAAEGRRAGLAVARDVIRADGCTGPGCPSPDHRAPDTGHLAMGRLMLMQLGLMRDPLSSVPMAGFKRPKQAS